MNPGVNHLLLSTALLGTFFSGTATRIVAISMPTVASSLGTDLIGISWALLAYQISNIALSIIFGRVSDLWGREKVFGLGFVVFSLSSLLCGLSSNVMQLILSRFLQGVGRSMLQSSSRALAAESVPEALAGRAQGYMTTAHHLGFVLGPSIGGLMIDYFTWRWSFFLLVPIGLCGALLTLASLSRRSPVPQHPNVSIDYLGATLLVATTTLLVLIFDRRTHKILGANMRIVLGLILAGCFAALIIHESKTQSPFVNLSLFRIRRFAFSVVSLLIIAMCYSLIGFLMPFYLQDILDLSATAVGVLFMVPSILTVAFAPLSGSMSDRFGPRTPATLGAAIMVLALGVGGLLKTDSHWLLPALLIVLSAITNGIFNPANSTAMIGLMPSEHRGFASSMNHVTFGVGNVLGIAMGSFVMAAAFEHYTGLAGVSPTTDNPQGFVAAVNVTFVAATVLSFGAVAASVARGNGSR
ncbi:MAG TPA: MFS transporter [Candidatus Binatia bacterium]